MFGIIAASASFTGELKTLTFIGSNDISTTTTGQTQTLNYPAGTQAGDLLVLFRMYEATVAAVPSLPATFTQIASASASSTISARTGYRIVGSAESQVSLATDSQVNSMSMLVTFRPNFAITTVTPTIGTNSINASTITATIDNGSTTNSPYVAFIHTAGTGVSPHTYNPSAASLGMNEIDHSDNTAISRSLTVLYRRFNQGDSISGVNLSTTTSDAGTNAAQAFRIAVS